MLVSQNIISMDRAMNIMANNLDNQDSPRIGIFWYDNRRRVSGYAAR